MTSRGNPHCNTLTINWVATWLSGLSRGFRSCSELQCVAVCCSVLQCVAVCCSVLQCVAVSGSMNGIPAKTHVLSLNESCHTIRMRHVSRMNESCLPLKRVMSPTCQCVCCMFHTNASCIPYGRVMPPIRMRHVSHIIWMSIHMRRYDHTCEMTRTHSYMYHDAFVCTFNIHMKWEQHIHNAHTHIYTHTHTHKHTHATTHTHTHTPTQIHRYTDTQIHTHMSAALV